MLANFIRDMSQKKRMTKRSKTMIPHQIRTTQLEARTFQALV